MKSTENTPRPSPVLSHEDRLECCIVRTFCFLSIICVSFMRMPNLHKKTKCFEIFISRPAHRFRNRFLNLRVPLTAVRLPHKNKNRLHTNVFFVGITLRGKILTFSPQRGKKSPRKHSTHQDANQSSSSESYFDIVKPSLFFPRIEAAIVKRPNAHDAHRLLKDTH